MNALAKRFLVAVFLAGFVGLLTAFNATKPRILVLHSGGDESAWVRGVDAGIDRVLSANRRPVSVQRHSMRLDRLVRPESRAAAAAEALRAVERIDPDLLVAVDDECNETVAKRFAGRARPRIVYVSIDQPPQRYGYAGRPNVTGIVEDLPLEAVRDAVGAIRGPSTLAAIGIDNDTGRAERRQVEAFDWSPHVLSSSVNVGDVPAWKRFVETEAARADVLLVLTSAGLAREPGSAETTDAALIASWVESHAAALPIGLHAGFVADGGGLAIAPAAADYGARAMTMALAWLSRPRGPPPEPVASSHFDVAADPARLSVRGVTLPAVYIEAARAAGRLADPTP